MPKSLINGYVSFVSSLRDLLVLGLATRFISIPLMVVMLVAITTVHLDNGFSCGKNGFEVPFYYLFMLFSLVVTGAGRVSVDYFFSRKQD